MSIELAPGADDNAFASMLADLLRQNLEAKPHKNKDFRELAGNFAIVADDADIALTLAFDHGKLVIHNGIRGVPDVAVRGSSDAIMALSNVPLTRPLALPVPTDRAAAEVLRQLIRATRSGELRIHGMLGNIGMLNRLTRVMSVNG
ncbi:MAG: hypothetical protein KC657_14070 [Myxococcales bacterium]|nr:hypothetical protein [Myxococcales bacterium]